MYKSFALIFLLVATVSGQLHRGAGRNTFSGLHNHWAIPLDGGQVWSWSMVSPSAATNCINAGDQIPNDATFTGSAAITLQCGGTSNPTIISTGMSVPNNGFAFSNPSGSPNLPNGWTLSGVSKETSGSTLLVNFNYPSGLTTSQYSLLIDGSGNIALVYSISSAFQNVFQPAAQTPTTWVVGTVAYTSATASSAATWYNNLHPAGSWTAGAGTSALPAVQVETDVGAARGNDNQYVGTIGFEIIHDHRINDGSRGFIFYAMQRAMMFRSVSIP